MKIKKIVGVSAVILLAAITIALGTALGVVYHKVAAFDRKHGSDVFANLSPFELFTKTNVVTAAVTATQVDNSSVVKEAAVSEQVASQSNENNSPELKVVDVEYDDDNEIALSLSERPDMDVVRNYVKVEPLIEGHLTFRYTSS